MKLQSKILASLAHRPWVAGALCVLLLSACGNRTAPVPPTATPEPTATATPAPTATPVPTATATVVAKKTILAPTPQVVASTANGIRVRTLSESQPNLASQQMRLTLNLTGVGKDNKPLQGTLDVALNQNTAKAQNQLTVGGNLLNPLLAGQLRGFSARGLTLYVLDGQTYALINTLLTVCVKLKPAQLNFVDIASGLSLDTFVALFAPDGTFPGKLVGPETLNGVATKHYTLDIEALKVIAAQRGLRDINITQGDVWLATEGEYVVRMNVVGNGTLNNLAGNSFKGDFNTLVELTGLNDSPEVTLPSNCARAIELP